MFTKNMRNVVKAAVVLGVVAAFLTCGAGPGQAAMLDWKGTTSIDWGMSSNWNPAGVPGGNDIARWDASSYTRNLETGGTDRSIGQYLFTANNTGGATIGGTNKVYINGVYDGTKRIGIMVESGSGAVTVGKVQALNNAQSWINNSSKLLKISNFWKIDRNVTIEGSGTGGVEFSGKYETGGGGGAGGLIVNLPNGVVKIIHYSNEPGRFTGQTSVKQGILSLGSINDYNVNGTLGYNAWPVILGDNGTTGTLQYTGGSVSRNRGFTLVAGGTGAFQVGAAGTTLTLSGLIDGDGGLSKAGAGTLTLSNAANSYTGDTTVSAGTLQVVSDFFDDSSSVYIASGVLNLNHASMDTILYLYLGSVMQAAGTYNASNTPAYLGGTGSLSVTMPEPATLALMVLGGVGLVLGRKRK